MITRSEREHGANRAQFEEIDGLEPGTLLAPDGRAVLWIDGQSWALRPEVHAARVQSFVTKAVAAKTAQQASESLGPSCPKCGDATNRTAVCPKCALGKAGLKYQYSCTCGATYYTREAM